MTITVQCPICKHYVGMGICEAYPQAIPKEILLGEHDHAKPLPGDHGIQFEPLDAAPDARPRAA